jgi:sodium transport system permease protein
MTKDPVSLHQITVIFRKELFELFRERRTIMAVVVGPLVITPLLFMLIGVMIASQSKSDEVKTYHIGVVNGSPEDLSRLVPRSHLSSIAVSEGDAQLKVKSHKLAAAVVFPDGLQSILASGGSAKIEIIEDMGDSSSQDAVSRLQDGFTASGTAVIRQRVSSDRLPPEFATPFSVQVVPVKGGGSEAMLLISTILPYLLIISAFTGTIYAAFDQVAGEKERGTLETLLVSPVSRMSIVLGKFLAVVTVCLSSCILTIVGLTVASASGASFLGYASSSSVHLTIAQILAIAAALVPLAILFAGLLLTVSILARNQKEAQTILGPLMSVIIVPAIMSTIINGDVGNELALVPILNAALIIKLALSNRFEPTFIAIAFVASIGYAAIALVFAASLFQKESVLLKA